MPLELHPPPSSYLEIPSSSPQSPHIPSEPTTIHSLPAELLLLIASHLTYPAIPIIRFTHPFFYYALPATVPTFLELLAAELTSPATTLDLLGCATCLRMLPARYFRHSQSAVPRGCNRGGRQCYRCECQRLEQWRLYHMKSRMDTKPEEVRLLEPAGRTAMRVNCKLCWAPLGESEALKRKRWGYCEGCAKVGCGQTLAGLREPLTVEEWARRWEMSTERGR
ncbi:hypothetical protein MMC11_004128 [Xylographa trunciseda]|nr:hypothetical protein [Xylographa trunciseda]